MLPELHCRTNQGNKVLKASMLRDDRIIFPVMESATYYDAKLFEDGRLFCKISGVGWPKDLIIGTDIVVRLECHFD